MPLKILPFGRAHALNYRSITFLDEGQRNWQIPKMLVDGEVQAHERKIIRVAQT